MQNNWPRKVNLAQTECLHLFKMLLFYGKYIDPSDPFTEDYLCHIPCPDFLSPLQASICLLPAGILLPVGPSHQFLTLGQKENSGEQKWYCTIYQYYVWATTWIYQLMIWKHYGNSFHMDMTVMNQMTSRIAIALPPNLPGFQGIVWHF